jgi:site-specific DNA-methyltransferase (adenine-specific)
MIQDYVNMIIEGDCLEILPKMPDQSIDMVLCDLPYGCTQNKWDSLINLPELWLQYKRLIKPNGVIVLTAQGAFTAKLINSNLEWFKYKIVWIKSKATNFLNANKQPLRRHEDICIFYKKQPCYQPQMTSGTPYDRGMRKDNRSDTYGLYKESYCCSIDGKRFPSDVLFHEEDLVDYIYHKTAETEGKGFHPTQKPTGLGRWLIKTFTRPGDIVLDNACGSGSFLVSAILEHRKFIGIDKNDQSFHLNEKVDYIAISNQRVTKAIAESRTLLDN